MPSRPRRTSSSVTCARAASAYPSRRSCSSVGEGGELGEPRRPVLRRDVQPLAAGPTAAGEGVEQRVRPPGRRGGRRVGVDEVGGEEDRPHPGVGVLVRGDRRDDGTGRDDHDVPGPHRPRPPVDVQRPLAPLHVDQDEEVVHVRPVGPPPCSGPGPERRCTVTAGTPGVRAYPTTGTPAPGAEESPVVTGFRSLSAGGRGSRLARGRRTVPSTTRSTRMPEPTTPGPGARRTDPSCPRWARTGSLAIYDAMTWLLGARPRPPPPGRRGRPRARADRPGGRVRHREPARRWPDAQPGGDRRRARPRPGGPGAGPREGGARAACGSAWSRASPTTCRTPTAASTACCRPSCSTTCPPTRSGRCSRRSGGSSPPAVSCSCSTSRAPRVHSAWSPPCSA